MAAANCQAPVGRDPGAGGQRRIGGIGGMGGIGIEIAVELRASGMVRRSVTDLRCRSTAC
jgi:hypothetical protein